MKTLSSFVPEDLVNPYGAIFWNATIAINQKDDFENLFAQTYEQFANLRMVIAFKYFSNAKFKAFKCKMDDFQMQENDAKQLKQYIDDIQKEWPKATIEPYLIYCFGNQGFKVYPLNMMRNP